MPSSQQACQPDKSFEWALINRGNTRITKENRAGNAVRERVEEGGLGMRQTLRDALSLQSCITQLGFFAPSDQEVLPASRGHAVLSFSPVLRAAFYELLEPLKDKNFERAAHFKIWKINTADLTLKDSAAFDVFL